MKLLELHKGAGQKNSQFGLTWYHRGGEAKRFKAGEAPDGWNIGRVPPKSREQRNQEKSVSRKSHELVCASCSATFKGRLGQRTCSDKCAKKIAGPKAAATMKDRGTHAGWHTRRGEASYPEKYFEDVFSKEGISGWTREKKVGRWFIDFAFSDRMIAVEIDGRQHDERVESDTQKDEFLRSKGWTVIRVRWYNPRTEQGREKLHPQVKKLLATLKDTGIS
jgi:very-short-patch-repair endonuclease